MWSLCQVGFVVWEWWIVINIMVIRVWVDNYDYFIKLLLIGDSGMYYVFLLYVGN